MSEEENTGNPFRNLELEDEVLRSIIVDDRTDSSKVTVGASKNLGYLLNTGFPKEIFTGELRQWIYEKIISNYVKHSEPISRETLISFLEKIHKKHVDLKKNVIIIDKILKREFKPQNFKPKTDQLKNTYFYRLLFNLNFELVNKLKEHYEKKKDSALELARFVEESNSKILMESSRFRIIEEDVFHNLETDILEVKDKREHPEKYKGIPTGFEMIDNATGGWIPGELSLVLGRPGMGKSILLLNFGYHAYLERCNVVCVTIEMPIEQQKRRFQSLATKLNYNLIKIPKNMRDQDFEKFKNELRDRKDSQPNYFWYIDAPQHCTAAFIESRILAFESTVGEKVDLLIVDPIYLMKPVDPKEDDRVGTISWDLKILARKLNFPVIAASQFNREGGRRHQHGKPVDTMDAAFTDKLSNNCDNMIGITGDNDFARLSFPKTRDSNIRDLFLTKNFEIMKFTYVPKETEDDDEE